MNTPQITAAEIAAQMQKLFDASLPELLESAKRLIERTPPKRLPFMQYVHFAMAERIFILIQDVHESFMRSLETGYFTSAAITRSLMESATVLGLLSRDNNGEIYSAFLLHQEKEAAKRRDGLAELSPRATIPHIQWAAKNEAGIGERVLTALAQARTHAALPIVTMKFPNMLERCRLLGEAWEFSYDGFYQFDIKNPKKLTELSHIPVVKK